MCTSQFSNRFVIAAAPTRGLREISAFNVWKQVILLYRRGSPSEVRTKFRWIEPKQRLDLDSSLRDGGWGAHGWNWASLSAGRNIDLRVSLVAEARESNTVGYASASAAANKAGAPSPRKSSPRWMHHSLRFETNFEPIGLSNQGIQWRFGTITIKLRTSAKVWLTRAQGSQKEIHLYEYLSPAL
jgi:hypothetical protein